MKLPDRYKTVVRTLTGGGMSDAFVCRDSHLDRLVVIKALKPGIDNKRILDELSALSAIRSKHVVQVYDVIRDENSNVTGLVEEYLEGGELLDEPTPSSAQAAMLLLYPIAKGISDIHAQGRVHRDIKPDKMRRDAEGCLKIFDFGLAKIDSHGAGTKNLYFTPGFTPPEAFTKNADGEHTFTKALDVFAFGSTAYSLLNGGNLPAGLHSLPSIIPASGFNFSSLPQGLPAAISSALDRCLLSDPTARPTIHEILDLLKNHLLQNKHRASLFYNNQEYTLNDQNRNASLAFGNVASIGLRYTGLSFVVRSVTGPVFINNIGVTVGFELPGACVIVLGNYQPGLGRAIITVSVSHPEVTL